MAVHELVTNAIRHGGGHGRLELSLRERTLIRSISDHGPGANGLPAGPPPNGLPVGRGLYLARQLTGALLIDQRGDGVTATVELPATGPDPVVLANRRCELKSSATAEKIWSPTARHSRWGWVVLCPLTTEIGKRRRRNRPSVKQARNLSWLAR